MLVRQLITNSWYLSGIVARELETVDGTQITDGLEIMNDFLAEQSATGKNIPYYERIPLVPVFGQEEYFIDNAIIIDSVTYTIGTVRYPMQRDSRYDYWGTGRVNDITSLPFTYYTERVLGGSRLFVYFSPDQQIDGFEVNARLSLENVTLDQDLSTILDTYYTQFLKYSLARRFCDWYNVSFPEQKDLTRRRLEKSIGDVNYMDFTWTTLSPLSDSSHFSYADANLGKGWRPI